MNFILYTHTDYKDIWPLYFGQMKKYFPDAKNYIIVNTEESSIPDNYEILLYDDKYSYRERVSHALSNVDMEYCIFQHEDMFLYDKPNYDKLKLYTDFLMSSNDDKFFIKLIKGGITFGSSSKEHSELRIIDNSFDCVFAIQPTIWKFKKLKEVYDNSKGNSVWEFEVDAKRICLERNIFGYYIDDGGPRRPNCGHYDNNIYPYIATAVVKGKWNIFEYPKELKELFIEYNLNYKERGCND